MHIQTLHKQRLGAKAWKNWSLSNLQKICHWVNETGSAVMHHAGSSKPKSVLLQMVNILNTVWIFSGQLAFTPERFQLLTKSCAKFDSLFVNIQYATVCSLEKWTLKFKLLYPLNRISCFNEIGRICYVNIHIQRLKVWLKSILLKYKSFSRGSFFIGTPCSGGTYELNLLDTLTC